MSRHIPGSITPRAWRAAVISLVLMTFLVFMLSLLIAQRGLVINMALQPEALDADWTIRSGSAAVDRLLLRPGTHTIGLALHPIASSNFTLQARVTFNHPQGAAGLIVQADDTDHFTAFLVSGDGYFRLSDYRNGAWIDRVGWRAWPHIRRDGAANVLRAECQSDTCTFFVNDEWTWQEHGLSAPSHIGVVAHQQSDGQSSEADFDQISQSP